ncbi:hypothetical protein Lfu02_70240 [Longispora fulva]|uniref:DUF1963 domain-containing protein n=1 Tax=Longispora fulva TaxID=619741 RepID=A0A8J7KUT9_9ACTN|nr:hypothetical protein [Longispora fulva]MBG6134432.1 hypothetical protein [Longispora fulva]GIG62652.1 hypothetical protein Lfu02_70240 [Longispora fulva]
MTIRTPDRTVHLPALFPELGPLTRTAVRLHPRHGAPTRSDSSLGGPLWWPSGEPWPGCDDPDRGHGAWRPPGRAGDTATPRTQPLVPVLQLFARDVPELPFPPGTDLFQLLWCPAWEHGDYDIALLKVYWRDSTTVSPADIGPGPLIEVLTDDELLPNPCVLSPERVTEYPSGHELDQAVYDEVMAWERTSGHRYEYELAAAPGTKVGGWIDWIQSPEFPDCSCGRPMRYLLTIASWEGNPCSYDRWLPEWTALNHSTGTAQRPTGHEDAGLMLGDAGSFYLFTCLDCPDRPVTTVFQCS